jgi:fumarate hydratase subunit alpha
MREISASAIEEAVVRLIYEASYRIGPDIEAAVRQGAEREKSPAARDVLEQILESYQIARDESVAICQDTGMAVLFVEYGDKVCVQNGSFEDAVQQGVREAYEEGYLRKSVVSDPVFDRVNTRDNTPAVIHTKIVSGDRIRFTAGGKGFGSENMSAVKMLTPAYGVEGVKQFILDTVRAAGPNPCPPIVVGVGIGGTFERAAQLAKKATFRAIDTKNPDPRYAALEDELLESINQMGFGPAGLGGKTTALGVNIETSPTHIAGMPVAVNICCHAARHASAEI